MTKKPVKFTNVAAWKQQKKEMKTQHRVENQSGHVATNPEAQELSERQPTPISHPWPSFVKTNPMSEEYRFLNPYNFIRYLPAARHKANDIDAQLLGCCTPPPHDRYSGLTGRITCNIKVVTPLFVADSHDVHVTTISLPSGKEVKHKSYRFFQYDGTDAIPATSLRGMIRSLFEAVTNSPFSVFKDDERLQYRLDLAETQRLKPGIVRSLPKDGMLGVVELCEEAKVGSYYNNPDLNVLDNSWKCGEEAYAIIGKTKNKVPKVEVLSRTRETLSGSPKSGWLKITGKNIINTKFNESFFYFADDSEQVKKVYFDQERESDYNVILHAQINEQTEDFHTQYQHEQLSPDDLIYVELEPDSTLVRNISLVRVARLRYRASIGDLLPDHLRPSKHYNHLDIASRVFGWVRPVNNDSSNTVLDPTERIAYASRLRFSHATLIEDGDQGIYKGELPLAILGSPKPTTSLFYLQKREGEWSKADRTTPNAAETIGYDGDNQLRGRKVYRHHGPALNRQEYERAGRKCDHQNRSVRGVRCPGNIFRFTIDFHNLASVELGALLWVLQTLGEEGCNFRLGYAKPLGFGSVKVEVEEIELLDMSQRYTQLGNHVGQRKSTYQERNNWLYRFEKAMESCFGQPIRELDNIQDIFALHRDPATHLPHNIHYPRLQPVPQSDGKNYEWFVRNKSKSKGPDKAGLNLTLEIAAQEKEGLPLIERR
ncbi:MAG: TIGR03986 family CRISPR-associated RAMP protein [Anaerolineae bacterium]